MENEPLITYSHAHASDLTNYQTMDLTSSSKLSTDGTRESNVNDDDKTDGIKEIIEHWMKETFKKKICVIPVVNPSQNTSCQCGRDLTDHVDSSRQRIPPSESIDKWDPVICTKEINTNTAGSLFIDKENPTKFVRLSSDTDVGSVKTFLRKKLELKTPDVFVSIIGTKDGCEILPDLGTQLGESLHHIAMMTSALFSLAGDVDEIYRFAKLRNLNRSEPQKNLVLANMLSTVAMIPWGNVCNRKEFVNKEKIPYKNYMAYLTKEKQHEDKEKLMCMCNCILLPDTGNVDSQNPSKFQPLFQNKVEEHFAIDAKNTCVQLVISGELEALQVVCLSISKEPRIPVVVFKGTKGIADLLVFCKSIQYTGKIISKAGDLKDCKNLTKLIDTLFADYGDDTKCHLFNYCTRILRYRKYIIVCDIENGDDIQSKMLEAIATVGIVEQMITITTRWGYIEFMKEFYCKHKSSLKDYKDTFHDAMIFSLIHDRVEFVDFFLANYIDMGIHLSSDSITRLYNSLSKIQSLLHGTGHRTRTMKKPDPVQRTLEKTGTY